MLNGPLENKLFSNAVPCGYWTEKENRIAAVKLLAEKYGNKLTSKDFNKNGVGALLQQAGGIRTALQEAGLINKEQPWLNHLNVPSHYWDSKENRIEAVNWLVEKIGKEVKLKDFEDNGLARLINYYYNGSPTAALEEVGYKIEKPWLTRNVPVGYWNKRENRIFAIQDLVKELGKINVSFRDFVKNGLSGMISNYYNCSPTAALKDAGFDIEFVGSENFRAPKNYWSEKENRIKATKQLVEKLGGRRPTTCEFQKNGLSKLLTYCNDSPIEAFREAGYDVEHPWLSGKVPLRYWKDKKNRIEATKWLVEQEGKVLAKKDFKKHKLSGLHGCYYYSSVKALEEAGFIDGPIWTSGCKAPNNFWKNNENRREAVEWLINKVGGRPTIDDYRRQGLSSLISTYGTLNKNLNEFGFKDTFALGFTTIEELGKAIQNLMGLNEKEAFSTANYVLNFFGFDDWARDSLFEPKDRDVIHMLEDCDLVKRYGEEIDSFGVHRKQQGKIRKFSIEPIEGYRLHYWILNKEKISEAAKTPKPKIPAEILEWEKVYSEVPEEVWTRE